MSTPNASFKEQWLNDHLDMLNYAKSIGDAEWQAELLLTLSKKDLHLNKAWKQQRKEELLRQFDTINNELLKIYSELRNTDRSEHSELMDLLLDLKQQRFHISKQLESIG